MIREHITTSPTLATDLSMYQLEAGALYALDLGPDATPETFREAKALFNEDHIVLSPPATFLFYGGPVALHSILEGDAYLEEQIAKLQRVLAERRADREQVQA